MSKNTKTNLKLPIFLIVGPTATIIGSMLLYAIVVFIFQNDSPDNVFVTTINMLLFLAGALSVLAFVPCLIFGLILLSKRRKAAKTHALDEGRAKRGWVDVE